MYSSSLLVENITFVYVHCMCIVYVQMEEIEIPMVRGSMDDIGDEEVYTCIHVHDIIITAV